VYKKQSHNFDCSKTVPQQQQCKRYSRKEGKESKYGGSQVKNHNHETRTCEHRDIDWVGWSRLKSHIL